MAILSDETINGVSLTDAYLKIAVSIDVCVFKDETQRSKNASLGNKRVVLSDDLMADIYSRIKTELYPDAIDELTNDWKEL